MTMYLQKNYKGTFAVSIKNNLVDSEMFKGIDYITVMDDIPSTCTFVRLNEFLQEQFGCTKLVLDF